MLWHTCRCGAVIPQGTKLCTRCTAAGTGQGSRHMEYNRTRRNQRAAGFYVCSEWRRTREAVLRLYDGLDIYACYLQHRIVAADMVHHVIELEEDWTRRLDMENLLPLSRESHGIISALYRKDRAAKEAAQRMLQELIAFHWKEAGGIRKVLEGPD